MRKMRREQSRGGVWRGCSGAVVVGLLATSMAHAESGDVPCNDNAAGDVWTATIPPDANVQVRVDTNDAANSFDPAMDVIPAAGPPWVVRSSEYLGGGDDEFPCEHPPADGTACPLASGENGAWEGEVAFLVFNLGGCTGATIGTYDIALTVNASPAALTLVADDEAVEFVFDGDPPPPPEPSPTPEPTPTPEPSPMPEPSPSPAAEPSASPEGEPGAEPEDETEPESEPADGPSLAGCLCVAAPMHSAEASLAALFLVGLGFGLRRRRGGSA